MLIAATKISNCFLHLFSAPSAPYKHMVILPGNPYQAAIMQDNIWDHLHESQMLTLLLRSIVTKLADPNRQHSNTHVPIPVSQIKCQRERVRFLEA